MIALAQEPQTEDALAYHMLKIALERFGENLASLDAERRAAVQSSARRSHEIESRVIASKESARVVIDRSSVERAVDQIRQRYDSTDAFTADLACNGLDETSLRHALWRELQFDATLRQVSASATGISETDVRLFYELHRERFQVPESRTVRQILITINPDYPENRREAALSRIEALRTQAQRQPARFAQLARKHSECPSALEGGLLGKLNRGQLFPVLDKALFQLAEGEVSEVVESELGFHLLYCEQIRTAQRIAFNKASTRIREHLQQKRMQQIQKDWLASLPPLAATAEETAVDA